MSERTITGIGMPAVDGCPDCGSDRLAGTTVTVNSSSITLDGSGGVAQWDDDMIQDTLVMSLDCRGCGATLVEDSDVVHDGIAE
jgi:hypothetical protein